MCILCNYGIINLKEIYFNMHRKNLKRDRNHSFDSVTFLSKRREYRDERRNESQNTSRTCVSRGNLYLRKSAEVRIRASSFAVEKVLAGAKGGRD